MKFKFIATLTGCLLTLLAVTNLHAQKNGMIVLPDVTVTTSTNVSKKVSGIFKATFKDAESVHWGKLNKDFLAEFITADINNRVLFHKNGKIVYHIKYGHEKNLPPKVRSLVKSQYDYVQFNIINAINVLQDKRDIWVVNLEDSKKYLVVMVEDGELEEVSNVAKKLVSD
jgi:hypothetical protein